MKHYISIIAIVTIFIVVGCSQTDPINKIGKLLMGPEEVASLYSTDCEADYLVRKKYTLTAPEKNNWSGKSAVYVFSSVEQASRGEMECLVMAYFTAPRYDPTLDTFILAILDVYKNGIIYYAVKRDNLFTVRKVYKLEDRPIFQTEDFKYKDLSKVINQLAKGSTYIPFKSTKDEDYFSSNDILSVYDVFTDGDTASLLESAYSKHLEKIHNNEK